PAATGAGRRPASVADPTAAAGRTGRTTRSAGSRAQTGDRRLLLPERHRRTRRSPRATERQPPYPASGLLSGGPAGADRRSGERTATVTAPGPGVAGQAALGTNTGSGLEGGFSPLSPRGRGEGRGRPAGDRESPTHSSDAPL